MYFVISPDTLVHVNLSLGFLAIISDFDKDSTPLYNLCDKGVNIKGLNALDVQFKPFLHTNNLG